TVTTVNVGISDIPDATHITLAGAVATTAGQKVAGGSTVFMMCQKGNPGAFNNPTPYSEGPDPASAPVTQKQLPGGAWPGALTFAPAPAGTTETLTDDATIADTTLMNAASSPNRLVYQSNVLTKDVRISGTPTIALNLAFSKPKANLSAALVSYAADGTNG